MMVKQTLIYIDPGYSEKYGHYSQMGALIKEKAAVEDIEFVHLVGLDVSQGQAEKLGLTPKFKYKANITWVKDKGRALDDFLKSLDKYFHALEDDDKACCYDVFMYTAHPLHLTVIAFLIHKYSKRIKLQSVNICLLYLDEVFCLDSNKNESYKYMLNKVSKLIDCFDPYCKMTICSDSDRTKRVYGRYFKREIKLLPLPIAGSSESAVHKFENESNAITIGYAGASISRAGYELVYNTYKKIISHDNKNKIRFIVKHTPLEQEYGLYLKFLEEHDSIIHIDGFVSNEEYEDFLNKCDIMLLPYSKRYYPCQTSGVAIDAILREKIMIVPDDTWLSDQIKKFGSGEVFLSDNLESVVNAIHKVIDNIDYYKKRTDRQNDKFRALHSCQNLFSEIGLSDVASDHKHNKDENNINPDMDESGEILIEYLQLLQSNDDLRHQNRNNEKYIKKIKSTFSWKITFPVRWLERKWGYYFNLKNE